MTVTTKRRRTASRGGARPQRAQHHFPVANQPAIRTTGPIAGPTPGKDEILFLPLGGCSRIGMNMALYGHAGKWLIVDAGVAFMGDEAPGINALMADPSFIEDRMDDVVGLVVTHAHEDHIGAIHHLWPRLRCPIYATPFASEIIRDRLKEAGSLRQVRVHTFAVGDTLQLDPFRVESIAVTHSIPEPVSLAIRTDAGTVLHTGDWKFDPDPLVGRTTDFEAFRRLGDEGLLAMMCDSTNANVEGSTGSEADARAGLIAAFAGRSGAIAVTGFASNIARMKAVVEAAAANDRKVVLAGRSMVRMAKAAQSCGFFDGLPDFIGLEEASWTDRRNLVLLCTGSQGEERAALSRIARDDHRELWLRKGDTAIFSARMIPGNEEGIIDVQNHLRAMGVEVVTPAEAPVHVSGHPKRDDLMRMYDLVRPRFAVPVHGTLEHLEAHARLARAWGVEAAVIPEDGDFIRLSRAGAAVIDHIEPTRLADTGQKIIVWDADAAMFPEPVAEPAPKRARGRSPQRRLAA